MTPETPALDVATITGEFTSAATLATGVVVAAVLASLGVSAVWVAHRAAKKGIGKIGS